MHFHLANFKCLLLFTLSCNKTIALKRCLLAFVWHVFGLLIIFIFWTLFHFWFVSYVTMSRVSVKVSDAGLFILLSAFPPGKSIQNYELCVVSRNSKHTSGLTLNTPLPTRICTTCSQVLFAFLFSSALREFRLSSVYCLHSEIDVWGLCNAIV